MAMEKKKKIIHRVSSQKDLFPQTEACLLAYLSMVNDGIIVVSKEDCLRAERKLEEKVESNKKD
jgi:hypothetical protein